MNRAGGLLDLTPGYVCGVVVPISFALRDGVLILVKQSSSGGVFSSGDAMIESAR